MAIYETQGGLAVVYLGYGDAQRLRTFEELHPFAEQTPGEELGWDPPGVPRPEEISCRRWHRRPELGDGHAKASGCRSQVG